jgi:hypothetical protein
MSSRPRKRVATQVSTSIDLSAAKQWRRVSFIGYAELTCALALSIFIILLQIYHATQLGALWRDEACTLARATLPTFSKLWASLTNDSFPLLIYEAVRTWISFGFGSSDASLRALGALIGIGIVLALWLNQRLMGSRTPLLSLVLVGLNSAVFAWANTMRAYGLGLLLIVITFGAFWKVVESVTLRRVVIAVVVSVLSVQCLYQNAFLLFSICMGGICVCLRRRCWSRALVVVGLGAVSALSLAPYLRIIRVAEAIRVIYQSPAFGFLHMLETCGLVVSSGRSSLLWLWLTCFGMGIIAAVYAIIAPRRGGDRERSADLAVYSLVVLIAGTITSFIFLTTAHLATQEWYYTGLIGLAALSIELSMNLLITPTWRILQLALCIAAGLLAIPAILQRAPVRLTNIDAIAKLLEVRSSSDDFIVVNPYYFGSTFERYYSGKTRWSTVPPLDDATIYSPEQFKKQMMAQKPLEPLWANLQQALKSGNRVWVVGPLRSPAGNQLPPTLPPAPNGPLGWWGPEYERVWQIQLGHFFKSHAVQGGQVQVQLSEQISNFEDPPLLMFSGWRP